MSQIRRNREWVENLQRRVGSTMQRKHDSLVSCRWWWHQSWQTTIKLLKFAQEMSVDRSCELMQMPMIEMLSNALFNSIQKNEQIHFHTFDSSILIWSILTISAHKLYNTTAMRIFSLLLWLGKQMTGVYAFFSSRLSTWKFQDIFSAICF